MLHTSALRIALLFVFFPQLYSPAQGPRENQDITTVQAAGVPDDPTAWFDFWVGAWEAAWDEGEGVKPYGTNTVTKVLDGKVVSEQFQVEAGKMNGFKGTSISVYNPQHKAWHQAWADTQGGYFDFDGSTQGTMRIFSTKPREIKGEVVLQRMVFHDIRENSFIWDWEVTKDGGKTWNTLWQIYYTRIGTE